MVVSLLDGKVEQKRRERRKRGGKHVMSENCELSSCQILQSLNRTIAVICRDELVTFLSEKKIIQTVLIRLYFII